jgi:ABC-type uncharacterized transport system substrate-binding protein
MDRRSAIAAMGRMLLACAGSAYGQQSTRIPTIGIPLLFADSDDLIMRAFRAGLRQFGWIDGKNIRVEHRDGEGKPDRLPTLIEDLVRLKPDIFVAVAAYAVRAIKQAAASTPIVITAFDYDPVEEGFVASMNHPGGNITGIYAQTFEIIGKRLELLKDLIPTLKSVGVLYDDYGSRQLRHVKAPAEILGLKLHAIEMRAPFDYDTAFGRSKRDGVQALLPTISPRLYGHREQIARAALRHRLPSIWWAKSDVATGFLMSYGADAESTIGRTPYFINRMLQGDKPGEIPVEQPNIYKLWINLKTAKELGLSVPEVIMVRADEVIR